MRADGGALGVVPAIEPVAAIADGPWPRGEVVVGAPFTVRRQRLVAVRVRPFRATTRRRIPVAAAVGRGTRRLRQAPRPHRPRRRPSRTAIGTPCSRARSRTLDLGKRWRAETVRPDADPGCRPARARHAARLGARAPSANPEARAAPRARTPPRSGCGSITTGVHALTFDNLATQELPGRNRDRSSGASTGTSSWAGAAARPTSRPSCRSRSTTATRTACSILAIGSCCGCRTGPSARALDRAARVRRRRGRLRDLGGHGRTGLRLGQRSGWLNQTLTPLATYRHRQHFEISQFLPHDLQSRHPGLHPVRGRTTNNRSASSGRLGPGFSIATIPRSPTTSRSKPTTSTSSRRPRHDHPAAGAQARTRTTTGRRCATAPASTPTSWTPGCGRARKTVTRTASLFGSALSNGRIEHAATVGN